MLSVLSRWQTCTRSSAPSSTRCGPSDHDVPQWPEHFSTWHVPGSLTPSCCFRLHTAPAGHSGPVTRPASAQVCQAPPRRTKDASAPAKTGAAGYKPWYDGSDAETRLGDCNHRPIVEIPACQEDVASEATHMSLSKPFTSEPCGSLEELSLTQGRLGAMHSLFVIVCTTAWSRDSAPNLWKLGREIGQSIFVMARLLKRRLPPGIQWY